MVAGEVITISSNHKEAIDLYKMEYERCAQRYDDLYKAAWTNFSYIALISGAILTFGSDSFMTELSILVAAIPLLFWWIASFEPLNRYGDQVQARAAWIEKLLNELVGLGRPEELTEQQKVERISHKGLRHFQDFEKREFKKIEWRSWVAFSFWLVLLFIALHISFDLSKTIFWISIPVACFLLLLWFISLERDRRTHIKRVRFIVRTFAGAIIIVATCSAYGAYRRHQPPEKAPFIKSNSSESNSKLPERLNIKIEK